jgi:hypothetical protein
MFVLAGTKENLFRFEVHQLRETIYPYEGLCVASLDAVRSVDLVQRHTSDKVTIGLVLPLNPCASFPHNAVSCGKKSAQL